MQLISSHESLRCISAGMYPGENQNHQYYTLRALFIGAIVSWNYYSASPFAFTGTILFTTVGGVLGYGYGYFVRPEGY